MSADSKLNSYGDLVRHYHRTLDLVSPAALAGWDRLVADAQLYAELVEELAPGEGDLLDVGSGVGLPGIPLAIAFPERTVHLVERRRRRSAFLNLACGHLKLGNAQVHHGDVAELTDIKAAVVTAQAVGRFASIHGLTRPLQAGKVLLVSSKGPDWQEEAAELEEVLGSGLLASGVRERRNGNGLVVGLLFAGGQ